MGISKAKGIILGRQVDGNDNRDPVCVILGDGELQEGQIWESMAVNQPEKISSIIAIVDCNGIQSDTWTKKTRDSGSLDFRCQSYGWGFISVDGHNYQDLFNAFRKANSDQSKPYLIEAKTLKGKGINFAESNNFDSSLEEYPFHSGVLGRHNCKQLIVFRNQ